MDSLVSVQFQLCEIKNKAWLILFACGLLVLGIMLYWFFRSNSNIYAFEILSLSKHPYTKTEGMFKYFIFSFPSFIHVCCFSIFTSIALFRPTFALIAASCVFWVFVNLLFELGQLADFCYNGQNGIILYFINGIFDPLDMFFCVSGGFFSYFLLVANCSFKVFDVTSNSKV